MPSHVINLQRLIWVGLVAGAWVLVSGILMAAAFGYRDMKAAFDAFGIPIPMGAQPFVTHTLVRVSLGMIVVALFAIVSRGYSPTQAMLVAAAFTWFVGAVLPFTVIVQWGLFSWSLALKMWAWGAGEILIAAAIARWLYHP